MQRIHSIRLLVMAFVLICLATGMVPAAMAGVGGVSQLLVMHLPDGASLSPLMTAVVEGSGGDSVGSEGDGCFISASMPELAGIGLIFGLCMVGLIIGIRLIIGDPSDEDATEKAK